MLETIFNKLSYKLSWASFFSKKSKRPQDEILLILTLYLGDLCMALPIVRSLRKEHPNSSLKVLVRPEMLQLARCLKIIDEVIPWEKNAKTVKGILKVEYKLIYCFFENRFASKFQRVYGSKVIYLSKSRISHITEVSREAHVVDYLKTLTHRCGMISEGTGSIKNKGDSSYWAIDSFKAALKFESDYVVVHCDGRSAYKSLPHWLIVLICDESKRRRLGVLLTGQQKSFFVRHPAILADLRGETDLEEMYAIISDCCAVLGPDTGITHFSASLNKSTWVAMGPSSMMWFGEHKFFPMRSCWGEPYLTCRQRTTLHNVPYIQGKNCKGFNCINSIDHYCLRPSLSDSALASITEFFDKRESHALL